jgi:hypothetical protein
MYQKNAFPQAIFVLILRNSWSSFGIDRHPHAVGGMKRRWRKPYGRF